jgi:hypothetical protein
VSTGRHFVWKDATGAVVDVVSADPNGAFVVVDAAGRMWRAQRTGEKSIPTHGRYFSGLDCTGTEYTLPEFAARMPFALNEAPTELRVFADNTSIIQATAQSSRNTIGSCSNSGYTGSLSLLSGAPVDPTIVVGGLLIVAPLHVEVVP